MKSKLPPALGIPVCRHTGDARPNAGRLLAPAIAGSDAPHRTRPTDYIGRSAREEDSFRQRNLPLRPPPHAHRHVDRLVNNTKWGLSGHAPSYDAPNEVVCLPLTSHSAPSPAAGRDTWSRRRRICARPRFGGERGQSLIEFALCLPPLFLLTTCFVALGLAFINYSQMCNAANNAATQLSLSRSGSPTQGPPPVPSTTPALLWSRRSKRRPRPQAGQLDLLDSDQYHHL